MTLLAVLRDGSFLAQNEPKIITNGQLSWPDVKQQLLPILDDRFIVVSHTRFDV